MQLTESWSRWGPAISMGGFFTYATMGAAVQINVIENYREMVDGARTKKTKTKARELFLTLAAVYRQGIQRRRRRLGFPTRRLRRQSGLSR